MTRHSITSDDMELIIEVHVDSKTGTVHIITEDRGLQLSFTELDAILPTLNQFHLARRDHFPGAH